MQDRVSIVQTQLRESIRSAPTPVRQLADEAPVRPGSSLQAKALRELFFDQLGSRLMDVAARELKQRNEGFYTISSAGHEQNAVLGAQLRTTDPCFLHYRSGALMAARSRRGKVDFVGDTLRSLVASVNDPISGGRHKVWGSKELWVPPQTSTIASHLPKAAGMAFALGRRRMLRSPGDLPADSVVLCSFGDASANHATAQAGINAARYSFRRGNPTPVIFLCEDNRVGISVGKPRRWISDSFAGLSQLEYHLADGPIDLVWDTVEKAIHNCRTRGIPIFLRVPTVRLWGHAGSDVETTYRSVEEIEAVEAHDPLLANAHRLLELGCSTPKELLAEWDRLQTSIENEAEAAIAEPKLSSIAQVVAPMAPFNEAKVRLEGSRTAEASRRLELFGGRLPEDQKAPTKRSLAAHINFALHDEMLLRPEMLVFGEDVARKGGVYYVTQGLQNSFGHGRVFDTLLDETTILGVAQGAAQAGFLPVPEIQYLAYLHNAIDQLRGEASSLAFFSNGQYRNPMVVRIASFAYQRGFGGHFHNDNSIGALREIPGLLIAAPSRGNDAARLFRGLMAMAAAEGRVGCFLEPIALYHQKDLHEEGDRGWLSDYPAPGEMLLPGEVGIEGAENRDVLLVSYANGFRLSLRAAKQLEAEGIRARILDLRWLNPLPLEALLEHAGECSAVVVVDECRATGAGIADACIAHLAESGIGIPLRSVRATDSFIPLGPAANLVLIQETDILEAVRALP